MKLEHFALNVEEPLQMTEWYTNYLGLEIVRQMKEPPFTTFLADSSGRIMIEIYRNPEDEVPSYHQMNSLLLHLAFVSENPKVDKNRLLSAGASMETEQHLDDGSHLVMLRDPWGLSIQLCKRGTTMLSELD